MGVPTPAGRIRRALRLLREPVSAEKYRLLADRWRGLPSQLQTDWQVLGKHMVHCGYTMGPSYCSFGCTHCYLPANGNLAAIPTVEEMKRQVDANRTVLGGNGALQITGGDVVDAYWQSGRSEELVEICRYASEVGVVPMLMTHGQVLLENPEYLERLVTEGRLRKLAIHIDITQAGRPGYPMKELVSEADLHPLREAFVELILQTQRRTGVRFHAAHTLTVAERNIGSVGEVLRWLLAEPKRTRAFRMVSLQTEAEVGRTRYSAQPATPERTWNEVCRAVGVDLERDNLWFGHPDCSTMTTVLVQPAGKVVNLIPADAQTRSLWKGILEVFGGIGSRGVSDWEANLQRASLVLRHPSVIWRILRYAAVRAHKEGLGVRFLLDAARGRVGTLNIVMHNFMSTAAVVEGSQEVQQRLAACSFRGAVEKDGVWEAMPMCTMNALDRESIYQLRIAEGP